MRFQSLLLTICFFRPQGLATHCSSAELSQICYVIEAQDPYAGRGSIAVRGEREAVVDDALLWFVKQEKGKLQRDGKIRMVHDLIKIDLRTITK